MESLLHDLESDSIGLNIVCDNNVNVNKASSPTLKKSRKAKNKYEKRRANSKRAKKQAKEQTIAIETPSDTKQPLSERKKEEDKLPDQHQSNINDGENTLEEVENVPKTSDINEKKSTDHLHDGNQWKEVVNSETIESTSRKNQHAFTTLVLQDEAKRASYLSTFHARPYEIDRRMGATSHIQESKDSSHIFHREIDSDGDATNDLMNEKKGNFGEDEKELTQSIFTKCGLHSNIVRAITSEKFQIQNPTIIQRNSWIEMLSSKRENDPSPHKNLFIQSETGSGKTLAYLLVVLQSLGVDKRTGNVKRVERHIGGTRAVILCPTRELATQTYVVAEKLCQNAFPWLVAGCLSGGEKRKSEKARLRKGISVLIATPGRLLDHLEKTDCLLMALKGKVEWIVLDESDRLLDMGLGSQVEQIVQIIRANQSKSGLRRDGVTWRSILVSATISGTVKKLSSKLMGGDVWCWATANKKFDIQDERIIQENDQVEQDDQELSSAAPQQLTQHHMVVSSKLRLSALVAFLVARVKKNERVVLFMSTCDGVDFHHSLFKKMQQILYADKDTDTSSGIFGKCCDIFRLHGNVPHRERHSILQSFSNIKQERASILITTDVTARGLNMPEVDWIVQYDPPCETADYVHRAGRAARAGRSGHALLFLLPSETQYIEVLHLRGLKNITALSLASTLETAAKICSELTREGLELTGQGQKATDGRIGEAFSTAIQDRLEECILEDDRTYREAMLKKVEAITYSDKTQKKKQRRETKQAVGPLLESARNAYFSYVRGYSTKEKAVRHIFSARALHLGHVARSFALKEQPKELAKAYKLGNQGKQIDDEHLLKSTGKKRNSNLAFNKSNKKTKIEDADSSADEMPSGRTTKIKTARVVSFFNNDDDRNDDDTQKQTSRNIKEKMMAAASSLQSSGMEFW